jgi:hypothetical protein
LRLRAGGRRIGDFRFEQVRPAAATSGFSARQSMLAPSSVHGGGRVPPTISGGKVINLLIDLRTRRISARRASGAIAGFSVP